MSETLEQTQTATGDRPFWAVDLGEAYEILEISFTPGDTSEYIPRILTKQIYNSSIITDHNVLYGEYNIITAITYLT